jgi:hypothetical protein
VQADVSHEWQLLDSVTALWQTIAIGEIFKVPDGLEGKSLRLRSSYLDASDFATTVTTEVLQLAYVNEGVASFVIK